MSKKKKNVWFTKVRGSYLPANLAGSLTYIPYLAYLVGVLAYVCQQNYGFWLDIFIVIPNWITAVAIMNWIAARKS